MTTSFQKILDTQQLFESLFVDFGKTHMGSPNTEAMDKYADYLSTALAREAFEFRDEFNWKLLARPKVLSYNRQVEEAMDCFIFSLNLLLILGLDAEEIEAYYYRKADKNWQRQINNGNDQALKLYERYEQTKNSEPKGLEV